MLQLKILSGKQAGVIFDARRFPVRVGREAANEFRLDDDGVWDSHFNISLDPAEGFTVTVHPGALLNVNNVPLPLSHFPPHHVPTGEEGEGGRGSNGNSETIQSARLRNGDIITAGSVRLAFRIGETSQPGLGVSEAFVWSLVAVITAMEVTLVYWLLP